MGAGQSVSANDNAAEKTCVDDTETNVSSSSSSKASSAPSTKKVVAKKVKQPPKNETGYDRAQRVCRKKKRAYDACYTAQLSSKEEDCSDLFEEYRSCFLRVIAKDMDKRGVQVSENSMIGEFKEEIADEDDDNDR